VGRSSTSGMHHWWQDAHGDHRDEAWTGDLAGDPAVCTFGDQLHVFGRDTAGTLHHWWLDLDGVHDESWGGDLAGAPAACATADQLHVFGRDTAGNLHHWWTDRSGTRSDEDLFGAASGGALEGTPCAYLAHDPQRGEALVVLGRSGAQVRYWWRWTSGTESWEGPLAWPVPSDVGRYAPLDGDLFGCAYDDRLRTFGRYGSSAGQFHGFGRAGGGLGHWTFDSDTGPWDQLWPFQGSPGSPGQFLAGSPCGFVVGDQVHVFGRDGAARLHHWVWDPGLGLVQQDWGGSLTGDPAAVLDGDQQHVFGRNSAGHLHHWLWDPAMGSAQPPRLSPAVPPFPTDSAPSVPLTY
jgi:Repeat of unknown function (DUF346)